LENSELFSELILVGHDADVNGIVALLHGMGLSKYVPDIVWRLQQNGPTSTDIKETFAQICHKKPEETHSNKTKRNKPKRKRDDTTGRFQTPESKPAKSLSTAIPVPGIMPLPPPVSPLPVSQGKVPSINTDTQVSWYPVPTCGTSPELGHLMFGSYDILESKPNDEFGDREHLLMIPAFIRHIVFYFKFSDARPIYVTNIAIVARSLASPSKDEGVWCDMYPVFNQITKSLRIDGIRHAFLKKIASVTPLTRFWGSDSYKLRRLQIEVKWVMLRCRKCELETRIDLDHIRTHPSYTSTMNVIGCWMDTITENLRIVTMLREKAGLTGHKKKKNMPL